MAGRSGPFTIRGVEFQTESDGTITRTEPAVAARVRNPAKRQLQRQRDNSNEELANVNEELTALTARRDALVQEVADLDTLLLNAREDSTPAAPASVR